MKNPRLPSALVTLAALLLFAGLCAGLVFAAAGRQIIDVAQKLIIQVSLANRQADLNRPMSDDQTPLRFTVAVGDTPPIIAQKLAQAGLVTDPSLFVDYVRLYGLDRQLEAGVYFLRPSQTIPEIARALTDSASSQFAFRILEGWRLEEVAAAVDTNPYFSFTGGDFLALVGPGAPQDAAFVAYAGLPVGASLEGFLYPETYQLPADVTPAMLRDILIQEFRSQVGEQIPLDAAAQGLSLFQVVILASITEREAVHADEQPLIAGVYRNRLAIGMRLEADPTVQYGIGYRDGSWWPKITAADYRTAISPYNTYLNDGLPPGPIASPGIEAIRAVVYPTPSNYYYFRADCRTDGYHDFAVTFQEHLANGC